MMRIAIVKPAMADAPKVARIANRPTQLVVLMNSCAMPLAAVVAIVFSQREIRSQVRPPYAQAARVTGEMP